MRGKLKKCQLYLIYILIKIAFFPDLMYKTQKANFFEKVLPRPTMELHTRPSVMETKQKCNLWMLQLLCAFACLAAKEGEKGAVWAKKV